MTEPCHRIVASHKYMRIFNLSDSDAPASREVPR